MNYSSHCPKCTTVRCENCHLYVVELDWELLKFHKFTEINPHYREGMDCLYVGSSTHTPVCRFTQHKLHAKKGVNAYVCFCDGKKVVKQFVRSGGHTRGSYYPGVYGLRLRPDLYQKSNPIASKNAFVIEAQFAQKLRKLGYAVWQH